MSKSKFREETIERIRTKKMGNQKIKWKGEINRRT
jgi:hypothetical protein